MQPNTLCFERAKSAAPLLSDKGGHISALFLAELDPTNSIPVAEKVPGIHFPTVSTTAGSELIASRSAAGDATTAYGSNLERVSLAVTLPISDDDDNDDDAASL